MQAIATTESEAPVIAGEAVVHMPLGLLGFEKYKSYVLTQTEEEAPFSWLQAAEHPSLAFLVIHPSEIPLEYQPDLSDEDVRFLGLENPADARILNIVTLRANGRATVNLKGPLVINQRTLRGKQVIPVNASQFSLQYPLPVVA